MPKSKIHFSDDIHTPRQALSAIQYVYRYLSKFEVEQRLRLANYVIANGKSPEICQLLLIERRAEFELELRQLKEIASKILKTNRFQAMRLFCLLINQQRLEKERMALLTKATKGAIIKIWLRRLTNLLPHGKGETPDAEDFILETEWDYMTDLVLRSRNPAHAEFLLAMSKNHRVLREFADSEEASKLKALSSQVS